MVATVLGEINFVKQVIVFSDRLGVMEYEKLQEDF